MPESTPIPSERALLTLRLGVALILGVHPVTRLLQGTIPMFGGYLSSIGFPSGYLLAWCITLFELGGVLSLATGRFMRFAIPGQMLILVSGIVLVHGREGWFVVGGGRNGVEFSVLLLLVLCSLFLATPKATAPASS